MTPLNDKVVHNVVSLRHYSQKAYETMRHCVSLPSQRTIWDYNHHLKAVPGFSDRYVMPHIYQVLKKERDIQFY